MPSCYMNVIINKLIQEYDIKPLCVIWAVQLLNSLQNLIKNSTLCMYSSCTDGSMLIMWSVIVWIILHI